MKLRPDGNWMAKIICLVIAVVLWLFIMNEQNPVIEGQYTVPVSMTGLPSSLVAKGVPDTVTVKLRMQRNTMLALRESDIYADVDLSHTEPGEYPQQRIRITVPQGVEVIGQTPAEFTLHVENFVVRTLPVAVHIIGKPDDGYEAKADTLVPDSVTVSGASGTLDRIVTVTATVTANGHQVPFQTMAPMEARDQNGTIVRDVHIVPESVLVKVKVTRTDGRLELPLKAPIVGEPAAGYGVGGVEVIPDRVMIQSLSDTVQGQEDWRLRPISVAGATEDIVTQVPIPVPAGGTAEPRMAEVHVRIVPQT